MSFEHPSGSDSYLVNTLKGMGDSNGEGEHPMFHGMHNDYLANRLKPKASAAERFVSIFFWVAVAAVVAIIAILIASIVLQKQQTKLLAVTSFSKTFVLSDGATLTAVVTQPVNMKVKRPVVFELSHNRLLNLNSDASGAVGNDMATHGLIVIQVNARGTGPNANSPRPDFPMTTQDIADAVELATQFKKFSGSNGAVGMFGLGSSATLALLTAQQTATPISAVLAVHAVESPFWDDFYPDGNFQPNLFKALFEQDATLPAAPTFALDQVYFNNRYDIARAEPYIFKTLEHQTFDGFWQALQVDPSRISIPVYMIAGLYNPHKDFALNLYNTLLKTTPKSKVVLGPFEWTWPDEFKGAGGFAARSDAAFWFKQWLAEEDNGLMRQPDITMFFPTSFNPGPSIYYENTDPPMPGANPTVGLTQGGKYQYTGWPLYYRSTSVGDMKVPYGPGTSQPASGFELGHAWGLLPGNQTGEFFVGSRGLTIPFRMATSTPYYYNSMTEVTLTVSTSAPPNVPILWQIWMELLLPNDDRMVLSGCTVNDAMTRAAPVNATKDREPGKPYDISCTMKYAVWTFQNTEMVLHVTTSAPGMTWSSPEDFTFRVSRVADTTYDFDPKDASPRRRNIPPAFTQVTAKNVESDSFFTYNRTLALNRAQVFSPTSSALYQAQGTYYNLNNVLVIGFVGSNITVSNNDMTQENQAHHIIIKDVNLDTPDDAPGLNSVYLHDLLDQLQQQYSYGLNVQAVHTASSSRVRAVPNLALSQHAVTEITTSTSISADADNFYVTATRTAKDSQTTLPPQTASKTFPRQGH